MVSVDAENADEPVWQQITDNLSSHFQSRELVLETPSVNPIFGNASQDISQTGLQFLLPGNNKADGSRLLKPADVPGCLLTVNYLRSVAAKIENPIDSNPLLFLCMTFIHPRININVVTMFNFLGPMIGNISGNLPSQLALLRGRHYCLARRAMDCFGTSDLREPSEEPECFAVCPQVVFIIIAEAWANVRLGSLATATCTIPSAPSFNAHRDWTSHQPS
jgi:hypothetical protein